MSIKTSSIFTQEQLKKMQENDVTYFRAYKRVRQGMDPEIACSIKYMHYTDWENSIFALYKGEKLIADGTVYEIAKKTGKSVKTLKFYSYDSYKKREKRNRLVLEFLYNELEEEEL